MHTLAQLRAGELQGITRLQLREGLTTFPQEIFELADSLEILDLSGNQLTALPDDLPRLHRLQVIFCSDNPFTDLPEVLGQCPQLTMVGFKANRIRHVSAKALPPRLRWLILTDNQIDALPDELGRCTALQKLMLAGNRLRHLPASMAALHQLELLRISANQFTVLPAWLLKLPRLSWLAFAGNPFCADLEAAVLTQAAAHAIDWSDLQVEQLLGEGASGLIYRAEWQQALTQDAQASTQIAVKVFKGALTSDGLPVSEMAASLHAGVHPHLVAVHAPVTGHPDGKEALAMPWVAPHFQNLAGPPSLASCTRDVYPPDTRLPMLVLLRLAHGVASAALHLHQCGLTHGDLYAHNILYTADGDALLGDFGAAGFLDRADHDQAQAIQGLEVRAFGLLLAELLRQGDAGLGTPQNAPICDALQQLSALCCLEVVQQRPLFAAITAQLSHHLKSATPQISD
jgi:hypothetical protein